MPSPPEDPRVLAEMERADGLLQSLKGSTVPTLTLNSLDVEDAPFLGLITSKLSPIIGNLVERQITELLTSDAGHGMRWVRQDPDFPDALLIDRDGASTLSGYEVKAWYVMSTELTGRFRESVNLLRGKNIRIAIVAWHLSNIVYGTPEVTGVLTTDAMSVAERRDTHYYRPPDYLCEEPRDTTARTRNLQQTNVGGFKWQGTATDKEEAVRFVQSHAAVGESSHTAKAQALITELRNRYSYRLDTNFAKVDRINHPAIEAFKSEMLRTTIRGRRASAWITLLKKLGDPTTADYKAAAAEIQRIYDEL